MSRLKQLYEERAQVRDQIDAIFGLCEKEKRSRNEDEKKKFNELTARESELDTEIKDLEAHEERKKALATDVRPVNFDTPGKDSVGKDEGKNLRKLSITKAIRQIRDNKFDGVEKEVNDWGKKQLRAIGKEADMGFSIPAELIAWGERDYRNRFEKRDFTIGTEGPDIMQTDLGALIPLLRPQPILDRLGVQFLTGLTGDFQLPRQTAAATMSWQTETGASTESTPTMDNIKLTPKRCSGYVDISRLSTIQSSFSIEQWVRNEIQTALAQELDRVGINGSGASNEPTGVLNTAGVGTVDHGAAGGAPTWAKVLEFISDIEVANAPLSSLAYLSTFQNKAKMMSTPKQASGVEGNFIMTSPNELAGYPFHASNQVPSNLTEGAGSNLSAEIFGNWSELYIGQFGAINLMTDPYTQMVNSLIRFYIEVFADVKLRHPASFSVAVDIATN
jgi:HK97 family phage major capsid protein